MNIENLKKIRAVVVGIPKGKLNMWNFVHTCGSPSCILGWAFAKLCQNKIMRIPVSSLFYIEWSEAFLNLDLRHMRDSNTWDYLFGSKNNNSIKDALYRIDNIIKKGAI